MTIEQVKEFHIKFRHPVSETEQMLSDDRFEFRIARVAEETGETLSDYLSERLVKVADGLADLCVVINGSLVELGFKIGENDPMPEHFDPGNKVPGFTTTWDAISFSGRLLDLIREAREAHYNGDLGQVIGKFLSMKAVVALWALEMNMPLKELDKIVFECNMSKLGEDGNPIFRESDGKILKGPNTIHPEPLIEELLKEHGAEL